MATLKELSKITGYSITTISRVLNEDETLSVTDATRKMILETAGKMDYVGKNSAQKKQTEKQLKIGIVEMGNGQVQLKDTYYLYMKSNVENSCFDHGIETVMMQYDESAGKYNCAVAKELNGILAIGQFKEEQVEAMQKWTSNIVFVDSAPCPEKFCSVVPNFEVGIQQGLNYLKKSGHRRIAFVGPKYATDANNRQALELRRKLFKEFTKNDTDLQGTLITTEWQEYDVTERMIAYLKGLTDEDEKPTVFFAFNETTAMSILRALQIMEYQVPQDFSILGYNDTVLAGLTQPQLSGVRIQIEEMAKLGVDMLIRNIKGEFLVPLKVMVPSVLVVRESVKTITE
ncbi:MAG: LacI family DNA-binding transcriptional regulator [Lachnospiraceae bacterium]|nr:LacI family DNA-binding transcriptional regulator [Lachnospiraceae bacterium]